jgi:hypothetical protein
VKIGSRRLRWPLAAAGLLVVVTAFAGLEAADSATPAPVPVRVTVSGTQTGRAMPSGFLGLSLEYSAIHQYLGRDSAAIDPVFTQLVAALTPGGSPVLRIGGDSTDHTWWPLPGVVPPAGVSYTLSKDWLATVHSAAKALNAHLILGVNLAADSVQLAGAEARALIHGIGGQYVDALEIGNEPDVYTDFAWYRTRTGQIGFARGSGWNEETYEKEFSRWAAALPDVPLAGPADAYTDWLSNLSSLISSEPHLGVVTSHRYPLRGCGADAVGVMAPTIANLLADSSSVDLAQSIAPFVTTAHNAGLPYRVDELNSASCGGAAGVSNTFASSLWIIDTLFNMASVGVDGVNIHTLPGAAYAPFSFTETKGVWHGTVNPLYYGLLMFSQAFPAGAHLLTTTTDTTAPVKVWSTVDTGGTVRTVVINEDSSAAAIVHLHMQGRSTAPVSVETLTAPSLSSSTGVQLGDQAFGAGTTSGVLGAPQTTQVRSLLGEYAITVPAGSAALITA